MENKASQNEKGVFINGRGQVVDLLRTLQETEREKILKILKIKNPAMARDLTIQCLTFNYFIHLDQEKMNIACQYISGNVLGYALSDQNIQVQKMILNIIERKKAVEAFQIISEYRGTQTETQKSQRKIIQIVAELIDKKVIQI